MYFYYFKSRMKDLQSLLLFLLFFNLFTYSGLYAERVMIDEEAQYFTGLYLKRQWNCSNYNMDNVLRGYFPDYCEGKYHKGDPIEDDTDYALEFLFEKGVELDADI